MNSISGFSSGFINFLRSVYERNSTTCKVVAIVGLFFTAKQVWSLSGNYGCRSIESIKRDFAQLEEIYDLHEGYKGKTPEEIEKAGGIVLTKYQASDQPFQGIALKRPLVGGEYHLCFCFRERG